MSDAMLGWGTTFELGNGASPEVFTEIAEVADIGVPSDTIDQVDVTHMKSPGKRREYISGLIDGGEATITINWIPGNASDLLLRDLVTSGDTVSGRWTFPNDERMTLGVIVTGMSPAVPIDDKMSADITLKSTGAPIWDTAP